MIEDIRGREISVSEEKSEAQGPVVCIRKNGRLVLRLDHANATRLAGNLEGAHRYIAGVLEDVTMAPVRVQCTNNWAYIDKSRRQVAILRLGQAHALAMELWKVLGVVDSSNE